LLTHSNFVLQMSIQQWWGSVVYSANTQSNYFSQTAPKRATENTNYRNKLMLISLHTDRTEPAVNAVT